MLRSAVSPLQASYMDDGAHWRGGFVPISLLNARVVLCLEVNGWVGMTASRLHWWVTEVNG